MPRRAKQHRSSRRRLVTGSCPNPRTSRLSAARRGYGRPWQKLRRAFLDEGPLCVECTAAGRLGILANEVDHIVPTTGPDDPKHYDWDNLQGLCKSCHSRKTRYDMQKGLTR